ncbi:multidrug resistance efflux transporter family protein [uncultured Clostridium sp.]|nr:multidrug resistance efflux transporter family protein [uncultured Clostridium sp.]
MQSFSVAVFSGVIATIFFFKAINIVKNNLYKLAIIESTQSGEVLFTILK